MSKNLTTQNISDSQAYSVINNNTREIMFGVPTLDIAGRVKAPRWIEVDKGFWKTNIKIIGELGMAPSTRLFFIFDVLAQMKYDNVVRGSNLERIPKNFREVALAFDKPVTTVSHHMKVLLELDAIRRHRDYFLVNPTYSFRFSMSKIPEPIAEAFPDLITIGQPVSYL